MQIHKTQTLVLSKPVTFEAPENVATPSDDVANLAQRVIPNDGKEHLLAVALDRHSRQDRGFPRSLPRAWAGARALARRGVGRRGPGRPRKVGGQAAP